MGHCERECHPKKKNQGRFCAYTAIEEEKYQNNAPEEKKTRREHYLVSTLSVYLIKSEDTWLIDSGAFKQVSGYKGVISDLKEKKFTWIVYLGDN